MNYEKYVCVSRNEKLSHHLKIQIGKTYLGYYVHNGSSISIYDENETWIGLYWSHQFEKLQDLRERKINDILNNG